MASISRVGIGSRPSVSFVVRQKVIDCIKKWYRGIYVPWKNDPESNVIMFGGDCHRPLLARGLTVIFRFWLAHWQWIIGTAIAVAAIFAVK